MKIYRDINQVKVSRPIVTIGSFDGVHLGHQKVIKHLNSVARSENGESVIFTFHPHPRLVLGTPCENLELLTTMSEKIDLLEQSGVRHLIVYPFTYAFSQLSYTEFVKQLLIDKLGIFKLIIGHDHHIGKNREGSFEALQQLSLKLNFQLEQLDVLLLDHVNISSTTIRQALKEGNIEQANKFLGYCFSLQGRVIHGQQVGRKIQFPTANIQPDDPHKIIPGKGVYAVTVEWEGTRYAGMLNIGTRPTINDNKDDRSIEVHILEFDQFIYEQHLHIRFIRKIREEHKFKSLDELKEQLSRDKLTVRRLLE